MGEEVLDRLDVLGRHGGQIAGAPAQQVGGRQLVQLVEQAHAHFGQQPERHVVGEPGFEPVQDAGQPARRWRQPDSQVLERLARLDRATISARKDADADKGDDPGDAEA